MTTTSIIPHDRCHLPKPQRIVIGFTGRIGSGKTAAAMELYRVGFTRVRFAGPLKAMMASLGLTPDEIDGNLKELPCELLDGKTPRWAMQTIGSEWGRDTISPNLWINAWHRAVAKVKPNLPIVADDVRFGNEADAIRDLGGVVIKILRSEQHGAASHQSEQFNFEPDHVIHNNGTLEQFNEQLRQMALSMVARKAAA